MCCSVAVGLGVAVAVAAAVALLVPNFRCLQLNNSTILERSAGIIGRLVALAVLVAATAAGACHWRDVFFSGQHPRDICWIFNNCSIVERIWNLNPKASKEIQREGPRTSSDLSAAISSRRCRGPPLWECIFCGKLQERGTSACCKVIA